MRVVVTGGCGFLGRRVALRLLERRDVEELVLFDNAPLTLPLPEDPRLRLVTGNIADGETVRRVISPGTSSVFHLAAVVSGEAEADTDLGYRVNLDGTRMVLDACRALGTSPRLVFASSLAVYGGTLPPAVGDETPLMPQTSYGAQKSIGELLVNDYSRKGFVDGRALRLPTVVVRPGRPNRAASTFASSMIREPLSGRQAVCPVSPETVMALASPRRVVEALLHAHDLPGNAFGTSRSLQLPGFRLRSAKWRPRCAAPAARKPMQGSAGSPTRSSNASSPAGRPRSPPRAPKPSAFPRTPVSTRLSRPLSRTTSRRKDSSVEAPL